MASRPTEEAEWAFNRAFTFAGPSDDVKSIAGLGIMLKEMAGGLAHLSRGLRATYMLLDQVNSKLDRLNRSPPGPR